MQPETHDVIIIGAGPAGLTAAQYAARAGLEVLVLEKPQATGALTLTNRIENYPGLLEPVSGPELLALFRQQAEQFGATFQHDQVMRVDLAGEVKEVYGQAETYRGKTVIIASGSMGRVADIPGEAAFLGKGVSYCATCDGPFFRGLQVLVVGDSDAAVHEAAHLVGFAEKVTLITTAKSFDHPDLDPAISVIPQAKLLAIYGDQVVKQVTIRHLAAGRDEQLAMDGVFIYLQGATPAVEFLDGSVSTGDKSCVLTHQATITSLPGVFAAGDVTCAAVRQVVVSAAYGCIAALQAESYLLQRSGLKVDWAKTSKS